MTKIHLMILISYSKFNIILSLTSRHKKTWDFFLIVFLRFRIPNYQTRKAHDITRERLKLILLVVFNEILRISEKPSISKNAFYVVLKFTQSKLSFFFFYHRHNFSLLIFQLAKV